MGRNMNPQGGYFQIGRDNEFPWNSTQKVTWYFTKDKLGEIIGYTPSKTNKKIMIDILKGDPSTTLFGVWTGNYSTSIFVFDSKIAIIKLQEALLC